MKAFLYREEYERDQKMLAAKERAAIYTALTLLVGCEFASDWFERERRERNAQSTARGE